MIRLLRLFILLLVVQTATAGAFDGLLRIQKPDERNALARKMYFGQLVVLNNETIDAATAQLQAIAKKWNDAQLATFALVMQNDFYLRYEVGAESTISKNLDKIAEYARQTTGLVCQIDYFHQLGLLNYRLRKFEPAFEYLLKANTLLTKQGICNLPYSSVYLNDLALKYFTFFDYKKAEELILKSVDCGPITKNGLVDRYNTLGLIKREQGDYNGASTCFQKAQNEAIKLGDSAWYGIVSGNMGSIFFKTGRLEEALALCKTDYRLSLKSREWESAVGAATVMIDIYLQKNEPQLAQQQMQALDTVLPKVKLQKMRYRYFAARAAINRKQGNFESAYNALDSAGDYYRLYLTTNNAVITKVAEQKTQVENHLADLQLLEIESRTQVIIRNSIIIAAFLLLVIASQLIYRQRQKQKQHLLNIKNARNQLNNYIESLREKNGLIEAFEREIETLQAASMYSVQPETESIKLKLQQSTILTEDDWLNFKHLFEQVYTNFFEDLKQKHQGLTQAETRLIALSKLNLSKKEMAEMLGVSIDAIRKTRQRIRYKLQLPDEKSLEELLQTL